MKKVIKATYNDLQIGDHFIWLDEYNDTLSYNYVILNKWYDPVINMLYLSFKDTRGTPYTWTDYKIHGTDYEDRLYKVITKSKQELIIDKIKYLDKRYQERNTMCS